MRLEQLVTAYESKGCDENRVLQPECQAWECLACCYRLTVDCFFSFLFENGVRGTRAATNAYRLRSLMFEALTTKQFPLCQNPIEESILYVRSLSLSRM